MGIACGIKLFLKDIYLQKAPEKVIVGKNIRY